MPAPFPLLQTPSPLLVAPSVALISAGGAFINPVAIPILSAQAIIAAFIARLESIPVIVPVPNLSVTLPAIPSLPSLSVGLPSLSVAIPSPNLSVNIAADLVLPKLSVTVPISLPSIPALPSVSAKLPTIAGLPMPNLSVTLPNISVTLPSLQINVPSIGGGPKIPVPEPLYAVLISELSSLNQALSLHLDHSNFLSGQASAFPSSITSHPTLAAVPNLSSLSGMNFSLLTQVMTTSSAIQPGCAIVSAVFSVLLGGLATLLAAIETALLAPLLAVEALIALSSTLLTLIAQLMSSLVESLLALLTAFSIFLNYLVAQNLIIMLSDPCLAVALGAIATPALLAAVTAEQTIMNATVNAIQSLLAVL